MNTSCQKCGRYLHACHCKDIEAVAGPLRAEVERLQAELANMTPTCHGCGLECSPDDPRLCGFCRVPSGVDAAEEATLLIIALEAEVRRMRPVMEAADRWRTEHTGTDADDPSAQYSACRALTEAVDEAQAAQALAGEAGRKALKDRDKGRAEVAALHQALRQVLGLSDLDEARIILRGVLPSGEKA